MAQVFQARNTGLWGFGEWGNGVNLLSAVYRDRDAAEKAAAIEAQIEKRTSELLAAGVDGCSIHWHNDIVRLRKQQESLRGRRY